ncbi:myelin basic protein-like [Alosa sapidissima]|uniref:myelin basic protein-like n=1 Tax=Alosa sapidissima TaxID=34773 RepID=UPI001C08F1FB|nr:myelin basic protein-like [Alosa sapidissima]
MGQHLPKREQQTENKPPSPEAEAEAEAEAEVMNPTETETQDEVFGEADVNQNNDHPSKRPAVTDSTGAEAPEEAWSGASAADPGDGPRPHLVRLFSRDAPGREDNTFKERPSESDELQTIQEHSGAGTESGSE